MVRAAPVFGASPRLGERILVFKPEWLALILSGDKSIEIRGSRLQEGEYWLGCRGDVLGRAYLGKAFRVYSEMQWNELQSKHLVQTVQPPYKNAWAIPLLNVYRLPSKIQYTHRRGAIGIIKFTPR